MSFLFKLDHDTAFLQSQFDISRFSVRARAMVNILPNPMLGEGGHAFVAVCVFQ